MSVSNNHRRYDDVPEKGWSALVKKVSPYVWALALASAVTTLTQLINKDEATGVLLIVSVVAIIVMLWVRMTACEKKHENCEHQRRLDMENHTKQLHRRDVVIWRLYNALVQIKDTYPGVEVPDISDVLPKPEGV